MIQVNVHEAKTHLSRLLLRVAAGEEVIIARNGHQLARLVPFSAKKPRVPGRDRGKFTVPDDFDSPLPPAVLDSFES